MLNNIALFNSLAGSPTPSKVKVSLFDEDIALITGPTPFVDISKSYNAEDNIPMSISTTINLTGKIVTTGLSSITDKIKSLEALVRKCSLGNFYIECDNVKLYQSSGVSVRQFQVDKSDNNWVRFADYTITLDSREVFQSGSDPVENKSESWTIEQIEDAQYVERNVNVASGPEYLAPNMLPTEPNITRSVPGQAFINGTSTDGTVPHPLQMKQTPQYRITRRLSAKGLPIPPSNTNSTCVNNIEGINAIKLLNAKNWVENQSAKSFGTNPNGTINVLATNGASGNTFLYNHIRSVSADAYNGTYEITDNWIAMPTGIGHTEKYTIECGTTDNFTKTVRVVGNINGLALHKPSHMATSGNHYLQPNSNNNGSGLILSLTSGQSNPNDTQPGSQRELASVDGTNSTNTNIENDKYTNAYNAWEKEIKPYLYRRACLGINTGTRANRPNLVQDPQKGISPTYYGERALSNIPVSTSEGHDPLNGTISYTYEFNNKYKVFPGVISENINITHDAPADNISETQIIGRYLGPLLQAIGRTNARKTITVDVVIQPPVDDAGMLENYSTCPVGINTILRRQISELIEGNKPFSYRNAIIFGTNAARTNIPGTVFVQSDQETWNPTEGRFSRTVTWVYQQCLTNINYMDH